MWKITPSRKGRKTKEKQPSVLQLNHYKLLKRGLLFLMAIISQINFFNYETDLEDYGDLERLLMLLEITQDEELIRALEDKRGLCGRNDYPVEVMWNTFIAGLVFQHQSVASLLRELSRNAQLRWLVSGGQMTSRNIPTASAMSRFEKSLIEFQGLIDDILDRKSVV